MSNFHDLDFRLLFFTCNQTTGSSGTKTFTIAGNCTPWIFLLWSKEIALTRMTMKMSQCQLLVFMLFLYQINKTFLCINSRSLKNITRPFAVKTMISANILKWKLLKLNKTIKFNKSKIFKHFSFCRLATIYSHKTRNHSRTKVWRASTRSALSGWYRR